MKKVCFIIDSLRFGGAQKVTADLASLLSVNGYQVDLVIYKNVRNISIHSSVNIRFVKIDGLSRNGFLGFLDASLSKVFGLPYQFIMSKFYSRSLANKVDFEKYNKVFLCSDSAVVPFHNISNKFVFIAHSLKSKQHLDCLFPLNRLKKWIYRSIISQKSVIAVSDGIKDDLIISFGISRDKIKRIYNFIDFEHVKHMSSQKAEQFIDFEYICHVGRHSKEKNIELLINAFSKLSNQEIKLVLVGQGPYTSKLKKQVSKLGLSKQVIFLGFQKNPYVYMKNAKCLVLSSNREGLPTVLLEALSLSTKVVSTNCPSGPSEILNNNLEEYLVPVNDELALTRAINKSLEDNRPIDDSILNEFGKSTILKSYLEFININTK
ncbi:glycosyltransferase [Vibrio breoganii]